MGDYIRDRGGNMFAKYKQVVCADGFKMSVQAGPRSYSYPKDDVGPYTEVEVGFPSHYEGLLIPYAENPDNPTGTVYGYTPARVVLNVLAKHGGIVSGEVPPGIPRILAKKLASSG
jgi:hypothetical protein